MISTLEMQKIIYRDEDNLVENENWVDEFYELWMERYHALNIVKSKDNVFKLPPRTLLAIINKYKFDEIHLFKIYEGANVFALLKQEETGYWAYEFIIIYKEEPGKVWDDFQTVDDVKNHFDMKEPILEIPLPNDRKYKE